jgi:integrase
MPRPLRNLMPFTDRSIKSLKAGAKRVDFMFASKIRGFGITVYPSETKSFFVRYTNSRGRTLRHVLGNYPPMTLRSARSAAEDVVGRVANGDDPQAEKIEHRQAEGFGDFAATYLTDAQPRMKPRSYAEDERVIRHDLLPAWRSIPIRDIRRRDIAAVLDQIIARGSRVQANRTRSVCSRIFAFAVEREVVEHNPVVGLRRPTEEHSRDRVLSPDEIRILWAIWDAEGSQVSALYRMLLLTGQRKTLVATMQWSHLDGCWWVIPKEITKNKKEHRVYLVPQAIDILASLRRGEHLPWVFPSERVAGQPLGWVNKAKERYRKKANLRDWRPHDLRRTMATEMGDMGIPHETIGLVLGHLRKGVTAIYDRASRDAQVGSAMIAWGRRLEEIVHGVELPENILTFPPGS